MRRARLAAALLLSLASRVLCEQPPPTRTPPAPAMELNVDESGPRGRQIRFYEEALPSGCVNLHHVYGPVTKLGTVIKPPPPSDRRENYGISTFLNSVERQGDGSYRLFYNAWRHDYIGMALSKDGRNWTLPKLGQQKINDGDSNLLRIEGLPEKAAVRVASILQLGPSQWRWYFLTDHGGLGMRLAESADGLHWKVVPLPEPVFLHPSTLGPLFDWKIGRVNHPLAAEQNVPGAELAARKRLLSNDSPVVYRDPQTGVYELYTPWIIPNPPGSIRRVPYDNAPSILRAIGRRTSEDGLKWADPELVVLPDRKDPLDLQFYHLAQFRHEGWRVGMLGHYRVADQTIDLELAFSRDGRHWERPRRGAWVPRGAAGAPDHFGIYPPRDVVALPGGEALLLYTGAPNKHNASSNLHHIMAATFDKDRLVGIGADKVPGLYRSWPLIRTRPDVTVNAAIRGRLRAEMADAFGATLPGFRFADCEPVQGSSKRHVLRWKGDASQYQYEAVVLRLEFTDGEVYGIEY
jgi:hypothetical protein